MLCNGLFSIYIPITPQYIVIDVLFVLSNVKISGNSPHGMHLTYVCILPSRIN